MALGRCTVEYDGWYARLRIGPEPGGDDAGEALRALWPLLQDRGDVHAVLVLCSSVRSNPAVAAIGDRDQPLGPKGNGCLKPVGVGVTGSVRNEVLRILAEADAIVATPDTSFADTSVAGGYPAGHAAALNRVLPQQEVLRLALVGEAAALSSERAAELGLVDAIVPLSDVVEELAARLSRLISH